MLAAISRCSLRDDVFNEDATTQDLEAHVAGLAGKEAGLFVLSGTMGNQVALRSLLVQPPHGVLADHRSHIIVYEAGGSVLPCSLLTYHTSIVHIPSVSLDTY
jgi:threonine aldolase